MTIQASSRVIMNFLMGILFLCGSQHANSAVWQMPPEAFGDIDNSSLSAADNNGHVMLLVKPIAVSNDLNAYYYTGGNWVLSQVLTTDSTNAFDVAMDPTGTALAIYGDVNTNDLLSRYFDGSVWSAPSLPLDNATIFNMNVAMNGPNSGVAVWLDDNTLEIKTSFYSSGTWSSAQIIATGVFSTFVDVFYSTNGTAVVTYDDVVINYNGVAWQAPQLNPQFFNPGGIDNLGLALLSWEDAGNINIARFNAVTSVLSAPQSISAGIGNSSPVARVAPGGTAVAVWINGANNLVYSTYNGIVWSAPQLLLTIAPSGFNLALDTAGNALFVYATGDNEIFAQRLPLGGVAWGPPELVSPVATGSIFNLTPALSLNGIGFAAWTQQIGEGDLSLFANASILDAIVPTPPLAISGFSCTVKFATQRDVINEISWVPSTDPTVVAYYIRRDGILIATVPSTGPFTYIDHNRCKNQSYVYTVTAVNFLNVESLPVVILLP